MMIGGGMFIVSLNFFVKLDQMTEILELFEDLMRKLACSVLACFIISFETDDGSCPD